MRHAERRIDSERRQTDAITKMSSKYPLDRGNVANGNRVGQRGVGELLQIGASARSDRFPRHAADDAPRAALRA